MIEKTFWFSLWFVLSTLLILLNNKRLEKFSIPQPLSLLNRRVITTLSFLKHSAFALLTSSWILLLVADLESMEDHVPQIVINALGTCFIWSLVTLLILTALLDIARNFPDNCVKQQFKRSNYLIACSIGDLFIAYAFWSISVFFQNNDILIQLFSLLLAYIFIWRLIHHLRLYKIDYKRPHSMKARKTLQPLIITLCFFPFIVLYIPPLTIFFLKGLKSTFNAPISAFISSTHTLFLISTALYCGTVKQLPKLLSKKGLFQEGDLVYYRCENGKEVTMMIERSNRHGFDLSYIEDGNYRIKHEEKLESNYSKKSSLYSIVSYPIPLKKITKTHHPVRNLINDILTPLLGKDEEGWDYPPCNIYFPKTFSNKLVLVVEGWIRCKPKAPKESKEAFTEKIVNALDKDSSLKPLI